MTTVMFQYFWAIGNLLYSIYIYINVVSVICILSKNVAKQQIVKISFTSKIKLTQHYFYYSTKVSYTDGSNTPFSLCLWYNVQ